MNQQDLGSRAGTQFTCPFRNWKLYFPNEDWFAGHRLTVRVDEYKAALVRLGYGEDLDRRLLQSEIYSEAGVVLDYRQLVTQLGESFERDFSDNPETTIALLGLSLRQLLDEDNLELGRINARLVEFPNLVAFKELKACLIGRFVKIKGTVVRVGPIRPLIYRMAFVCTKCQQVMVQDFGDGAFKMPSKCKTFNCTGKQFMADRNSPETLCRNYQKIKIQELLNDDVSESGRIPRTIECELMDDLVDAVAPGENVILAGILKTGDSDEGKLKATNSTFSMIMVVNSVQGGSQEQSGRTSATTDNGELKFSMFTPSELLEIQNISRQKNCFKLLVDSVCPDIIGHEVVKAGLLLGLFRGREGGRKPGGFSVRSNPHILVVGDPGLGKSQMLSAIANVAPRSVFVGANTSTAAGLTATLHQEGGPGEYALEAGALVLADQGCCCIDEFDKITEYKVLLDVMEQQVVNVAKAGVVCSLPARTSILAAANPVGGHYNHGKTISDNLKLDPALLSRFDLIFVLLDKPDEEIDRYLSEQILAQISSNKRASGPKTSFSATKELVDNVKAAEVEDHSSAFLRNLVDKSVARGSRIRTDLLRKYISYAQKNISPKLSQDAAEAIKVFFLEIRQSQVQSDTLPVTTRQLESAIRLSEARAKAELRNLVTKEDAEDVISLMRYCMFECFKESSTPLGFAGIKRTGKPKSKTAMVKEFVAEVMRVSGRTGDVIFSDQQLNQIYTAMYSQTGVSITFTELMEALNHLGYVIRKPGGMYKLCAL